MLKSATNSFIMHFDYHKNGLRTILEEKDYFNDNIVCRVYTELMPAGEYQLSMIEFTKAGQIKVIPTNQVLINKNERISIRI
jgi:hypothetical protein